MRDIPLGVLLLYTNSSRPYTTREHSTTIREFVPDAVLHPPKATFEPEAPLRMIKQLPNSLDKS